MKRTLTLVCTAALLTGSAYAATDATSPQGLLKGRLPDNAAGLKRVAITNFFVQYVTDFGVEMKRSNNTFYSKVTEPSPDTLQATADALYAQLVADLRAAGIEVVAPEQVAAQPALADLQKAGRKSPAIVNDSTVKKISTLVSAQGLPIVLMTVQDQKVPKVYTDVVEGTFSKLLQNWEQQAAEWLLPGNVETFSAMGLLTGQQKLAEALNATALSVRLTVPFVDMGIEPKASLFGGGGDKGRVAPNPRFVEAGTVFGFAQAGGNPGHLASQVMALQRPVKIEGLKFSVEGGEPRDGGGLVGALFGAAGANSDKADFKVKVDAAGFPASVVGAGSAIFKELAQTLATAK